jgi:hypothetical protein
MTITRRGIMWAAGALLGIAVTAALTWSVSQLSGQRIGLSSQPLSVIRALAPPPIDDRAAGSLGSRARSSEEPAPTRPSAAQPTPRLSVPTTPAPAASRGTQARSAAGSGTPSTASMPGPGGDHSDDAGQSGQGAPSSGASGSGRDD